MLQLLNFLLLIILLIFIFKNLPKKSAIIISCITLIFWYYNFNNELFTDSKNEFVDDILLKTFEQNKQLLQSHIKTTNQKLSIKEKINIPIYYINLDKNTDRKEFMETQLKNNNITNYHRISGVYGVNITDINGGTVDGINFKNENPDLTLPEIGCTLAHLKAIFTAYENNEENAIIMEDDCSLVLVPLWKNDLQTIINENIKKDWEIANLFTFSCQDQYIEKYDNYAFNYFSNCVGNGACVYVINRKGMKTLYDKFYNQKTKTYLVNSVADVQPFVNTKTYFINIPLFIPADDILPSTIHTHHQNFHTYFINNILVKYLYQIQDETFPKGNDEQAISEKVLITSPEYILKPF